MKVKIVKRAEVGKKDLLPLMVKPVEDGNSIVATVNSWIDNFRRKRNEEKRVTLRKLHAWKSN